VPAAPEFPGQPILKPPVTTIACIVYKLLLVIQMKKTAPLQVT